MVKNLKNCRIVDLDTSKEGFDALNATQKHRLSAKYRFCKNKVKLAKIITFDKNVIFWHLLA